jgi:hypothetical protein
MFTDTSRLILTADCTLFAETMTVILLHPRTTSTKVWPRDLSRILSHLYIGFIEAIVNKYQEYVQPSGLLAGVRHTGSQPESGKYRGNYAGNCRMMEKNGLKMALIWCQSVKVSFSIFIKSGAGKREEVIKYYINILIYIIKFFSPL